VSQKRLACSASRIEEPILSIEWLSRARRHLASRCDDPLQYSPLLPQIQNAEIHQPLANEPITQLPAESRQRSRGMSGTETLPQMMMVPGGEVAEIHPVGRNGK
jgi:hypothetical protein